MSNSAPVPAPGPTAPLPAFAATFALGSRDLPLRVSALRGTEALGRCHGFEVELVAGPGLDLARDLLGRKAVLAFGTGDGIRRIPGIVTRAARSGQDAEGTHVQVALAPRVAGLWRRSGARGFRNRTLRERLDLCLREGGLEPGRDYDLQSLATDPEAREPFVLNPAGENHGDHLARIMEEAGVFWRIVEDHGRDRILFLDSAAALGPSRGPVPFLERPVPGRTGLRTVGLTLGDRGEAGLEGEGDWTGLEPGVPFDLEGCPDQAGTCLPLELRHEWRAGAPYRCRFKAMAWDGLRPFRPEPRTPVPVHRGLLTGVIAGEGQIPPVDKDGRYPVRLPFPEVGRDGPEALTVPLRLVQPHHGMHLPLKPGMEVSLAPLEGNPKEYVITGALNNATAPSPTTEANPREGFLEAHHLSVSAAGNLNTFVLGALTEEVGGSTLRATTLGVTAAVAQYNLVAAQGNLVEYQTDRIQTLVRKIDRLEERIDSLLQVSGKSVRKNARDRKYSQKGEVAFAKISRRVGSELTLAAVMGFPDQQMVEYSFDGSAGNAFNQDEQRHTMTTRHGAWNQGAANTREGVLCIAGENRCCLGAGVEVPAGAGNQALSGPGEQVDPAWTGRKRYPTTITLAPGYDPEPEGNGGGMGEDDAFPNLGQSMGDRSIRLRASGNILLNTVPAAGAPAGGPPRRIALDTEVASLKGQTSLDLLSPTIEATAEDSLKVTSRSISLRRVAAPANPGPPDTPARREAADRRLKAACAERAAAKANLESLAKSALVRLVSTARFEALISAANQRKNAAEMEVRLARLEVLKASGESSLTLNAEGNVTLLSAGSMLLESSFGEDIEMVTRGQGGFSYNGHAFRIR